MNDLKTLPTPCSSCPWRLDKDASDIPNFKLALAENLQGTCPDSEGMGPDYGSSIFACHRSKEGAELACAGWLAVVGHRHVGVRIAVMSKRLSVESLSPKSNWPDLHTNYGDVLTKLRATAPSGSTCAECDN